MSQSATANPAVVVERHGQTAVRDLPMPEPGAYDALVRIEVCGLCGTTDRHIIEGDMPHHSPDAYPAALGHESVGQVVETGEKVQNFKPGDRVTRPTAIFPGQVVDGTHSAWAGFARWGVARDIAAMQADGLEPGGWDYFATKQFHCPADMDPLDASLAISLAEVGGWFQGLGDVSGKTIAIGGVGFAGCAMAWFAQHRGAGRIIGVGRRDKPLAHVKACGATDTINTTQGDAAEQIKTLTDGGADLFLEASGADEVFGIGMRSLRRGGATLAIYGAPVGYQYTLAMKGAPPDFIVRLLPPDDVGYYGEVCRLIREGKLDPALFRTHVVHGVESFESLYASQRAGEVTKGFVDLRE